MKILYLPIEIFDREFPARLLVAIEAVSKNYTVLIVEQNSFKVNLNTLPPGIILFKDHNNCNAYPVFKEAKSKGFITSALDEEGLIYFNKARYARSRVGNECMSYTDLVFSWGNDQYSILREKINNSTTKVSITGNPRFDIHLLNKEKRETYKNQKKVLINTRFGSVNSGLKLDEDGYIERMRLVDEINSVDDELFRREYFHFMMTLYNEFIVLIHSLVNQLPEYHFTIRPHPSESSENYQKLFKDYKNVNVSTSNSLEDDLLSHDIVVHNGCTTGLEAVVSGIPVLVYAPIPSPKGDNALPNSFGEIYQTIPDMISRLKSIDSSVDFVDDIQRMKEYIQNVDTGDAHKKIVQGLSELDIPEHVKDTRIKIKKSKLGLFKQIVANIPDYLLNNSLQEKKLRWKYVSNKFPNISLKEIENRIDVLVNQRNNISFDISFCDISCKKISSKAFLLEKK